MRKLYTESEFNPTDMGFKLWSRGYEIGYKEAKEKAVSEQPISEEIKEQIELIYGMYPKKCLVSKRPLGKTTKNKEKIKSLITKRIKTADELSTLIYRYSKECKSTGTFMMNFTTFLNNLPDYESEISEIEREEIKMTDEEYYLTEEEVNTLTPDERLDLIYIRKKKGI